MGRWTGWLQEENRQESGAAPDSLQGPPRITGFESPFGVALSIALLSKLRVRSPILPAEGNPALLPLRSNLTLLPFRRNSANMNYGIATPSEARAVLRALREGRKLTQAQVGQRLGLSQKRIARIESSPQRIKVDQLAKLIAVLGGRLVIEYSEANEKKPQGGW